MSPSRPKGAPEAGPGPARRWRKGRGDAGRTPLSGAQRALLAASFLITLGSFAVLPYMSVLLHRRLGLGLGAVGFVLAVASLIQFAGGVVAGPVTGRIGLRRAMLLALALRTAGFAAFVPGLGSPALAVGALLLVSAGAALYLPANKAYLVDGASEAARPRLLSASGSAFNAGMALGLRPPRLSSWDRPGRCSRASPCCSRSSERGTRCCRARGRAAERAGVPPPHRRCRPVPH